MGSSDGFFLFLDWKVDMKEWLIGIKNYCLVGFIMRVG